MFAGINVILLVFLCVSSSFKVRYHVVFYLRTFAITTGEQDWEKSIFECEIFFTFCSSNALEPLLS